MSVTFGGRALGLEALRCGWAGVAPVTVAVTVIDDDAVDVLTVTCDTDAETITIAWPEDGAMEVFVEGLYWLFGFQGGVRVSRRAQLGLPA